MNSDVRKLTPLEESSDEVLCQASQDGDRAAEEVLAQRYHRLVRSIARPYFLVGGEAEDLLQEGMFGLIKAMREYDPAREASFYTFAETCIRRRLYSVLKSANSPKHTPLNQAIPLDPFDFEESISSAQLDPEVLLMDKEKAESLLTMARRQLSVFESTVLGLYVDGMTCREIADTVGKSPKSVDNAVQRIRRKIGRQLSLSDLSRS